MSRSAERQKVLTKVTEVNIENISRKGKVKMFGKKEYTVKHTILRNIQRCFKQLEKAKNRKIMGNCIY